MQRSVLAPSSRAVLKLLARPQLPESTVSNVIPGGRETKAISPDLRAWRTVERLLRKSVQYHFDRDIQSAQLVDDCFTNAIATELTLVQPDNRDVQQAEASALPIATARVAEGGGSYG